MSPSVTFTIYCLFIFTVLIHFITKWKYYKLSYSLPGPFALPLIGNALNFFCDDEDIFERIVDVCSKYPSPMRFWFGTKFSLIIMEAQQAAKVLSATNFVNKDEVYKFIKVFNGEGLISGSGPKWKSDRKLMAPLFTKKNIEGYFSCISRHTKVLLEKLEKEVGRPMFSIEKYIHRCAADFVNESIIGIKTEAQNGTLDEYLHTLDKSYDIVYARIVKVWLQIECTFKLTHYWKEQESCKKEIHTFLRNVIRKHENERASGIFSEKNLLDEILNIREEVPGFASEEELVHHLTTLYTASEDPVTTITSFALLLLGMYPEIQEEIVSEIRSVIGNETMDLEDMSKMTYLEMCVKDVLRLFPIAPFIMRRSEKKFQLDKLTIPEGCSVIVSIQHIHRSPKYWEKPNEFYPEHFLPDAVEKRHPYAYLPFSAGPRGCLGKPYSYMAIKMMLVSVLQKYVIVADGKVGDIKLKADISVRPKKRQFPIRIDLRKQQ